MAHVAYRPDSTFIVSSFLSFCIGIAFTGFALFLGSWMCGMVALTALAFSILLAGHLVYDRWQLTGWPTWAVYVVVPYHFVSAFLCWWMTSDEEASPEKREIIVQARLIVFFGIAISWLAGSHFGLWGAGIVAALAVIGYVMTTIQFIVAD